MAVYDIHWHTLLVVILLLHLQCLHNPFVQACGGNFIGSSGVITSPSYPQSYQNNLLCVYTITQSQGLPIALVFEDFDIEEISTCSWDYVEIRDGNFDTSHLLTPRLCGSVLPPVLCSTQRYMRLLFRTDGSVQYRGFRATYSVCGGNFTESSGIIRSPSYPNNYPNNIDYSYVINQTDGYFIYLNFTDFSLEYSSTCTLDYVEIRNGGTFVSPVLGTRLCGSLLPPVQRTTTNLMWIRFKTNGSGMVKGFQASYTTCGGRFTSSTAVLSSPSYPNSYPGNMDCSYVISQSSGYFVTLTFTSFYLQSSVNCSSDFLEIRNGGSSVSPILGTRLCGSQLPPVQRTTQNLMWIRFKTDNSVTNYGFQASYTTCGGSFTSSTGVLTSPSYPSSYPNNMDCTYVISQPSGYFVTLTFTVFSLQSSVNCSSDFLEIRNGGSSMSPIVGTRLCGSQLPPVQRTTQNLMWIRFKTDNSVTYRGYQASYTTTCAGTFTSSSGILTSPSYPSSYPNNTDCTYVISQPIGYFVTLSFTVFSLQSSVNCSNDFLEIRNGGSSVSPILGIRLCGSQIPPVQRTTQNLMWIRFKTDNSGTYSGFQASYSTCGGTFTSSSGVLTSPSYPSSYPNNMDCTYVISQPIGYFVTLTFTAFSLQSSVNCSSDFLEIRNGGSSVSPILGTRLCGSQIPQDQRTTQNLMWIRFKTDNSVTYGGFQASYTTCGGSFTSTSGVLTSPSYPSTYPYNMDCTYVISQPSGYFVTLTFTVFSLQSSVNCSSDFLEIRNGDSSVSPILGIRLCGSQLPPVQRTTQNLMWIRFKTDNSGTYSGFQASYTTCGGTFISSSGILTSPSYPSSYPNNMDCTYVISQPSGYFVTLTFTVFSLQSSVNCSSDFLEIRNGDSSVSPILGIRLCGSQLPPVQRTTQNLMWIRFKTDNSGTYSGFQASYTTCGGTFISSSGILTSPSYPSSYPNNMDCTYVISQPRGYFVTLTFTVFSLQSSVNCSSDFLEIRNGDSSVSPILGIRLCGSQLPPVQRTTQNLMWIRFKTDNSGTYSGFQASYTTCGGTFISSSGILTSPSYPSSYPNNMDCTYVISQPSGYFVTLTFTVFSLQSSVNCSSDFLEIRNGDSSVSPILGTRLCGSQLPPVQRTTQNLMWIRFKTDNSGAYSGFQASYTTCGGSFTSSSGVLTSPSYPSIYPYSMDCTYLISQPSGYFVTLTFTVFSLQTSVNCSSDFLEIRDGRYSNSPLLGPRLCGTTIPATQRTTHNYMIIRFKSDSSNNYNGFRAEFSTCGGYFNSPYGTIESPSYPGNYANNLDCFYLISQTAGYFVGLTFTDFYLEAGSGCADDFIEVRDGSTQSSPQIDSRLCGSTIPPFFKSSQGSMSIRFRSNGSGVYRGFQASYTTCGGLFTSSSGVLTSPSYPSSYPNNMDCTYVISQSSGYFITLTFTIFYLQSSVNCSSDFLEIRNGGYLTSPLLGPRLCGTTTPPTQTTTQNFMFIHFKSDSSNNYNGFQAVFSECGGYFNAQYGTMHSPSYPSNYANNLDCIYVISQAAGYFVGLTFTDFYLEGGTGCPYDYIEIRDGNTQSSSQIGSRICGSTIPPFLKSSQGSMSIRFRSNWSGVYRGFQASYTTCGGIFTSAQGYIQSPSYPYSYSSNMDCVYVICMPATGYRITLSFRSFSLQGGSSCLNDFLEIRDGGLQTSPLLGQRLCGTTTPPIQSTSQHLAWIHFKSDNSTNYQGFLLFYTTSCTESYSLKQGVIQSPSFPSNYPGNIDCAYVISQQPGYYIRLNFTDFMLQSGSGCLDDFVEVRDGGYSTSPLIGNRFCGSSIPLTLKSTQNIMSIRFKTNNALSYRGFRALYDVAVSNYLSGQECVYVITQPQMYRVTLNFTRFYLTFGMNCTSDYVEILDGESPYSPILGSRFCGVTLPPVQRSTQNTMSIRFKIELSSSNKGFQAFYTADVIPQEIILVTDDVSVIHMDLETRSYSHISTTSMQQPMGVDYDPVEEHVYWTDIARGEICSSRLNNTDFRMMHFLGRNSKPYGIAVDIVSRLIFYTEARNNTIGLLTISNLSHKLLVSTDLDEPRAITLDKMNGLMFWSQVGRTPKIERANYDASDRKTLVATSIKYPSAIALDTDNNQLFWADSGTDLIECTDFEGRNRRLIYLSPDRHFVGMALLGNHLYLTDWGQFGSNTTSSYIRRIDKDGHNEIIFATFAGHLHTVHIYSERSQHPVSSSCARNNGNCSHICIPAPNNITKCMCPDVESLSVDRKECFSGWIIETDSSADKIIMIVASCGVLILIIITSIIVVVVIKRKKGQRSPNQSRNPQPIITRNPTYDGLNRDTRNTSCAERESSLYDTIEECRPETQNIDNPTYMSDENTYANQVLPEPNYENWGTSA